MENHTTEKLPISDLDNFTNTIIKSRAQEIIRDMEMNKHQDKYSYLLLRSALLAGNTNTYNNYINSLGKEADNLGKMNTIRLLTNNDRRYYDNYNTDSNFIRSGGGIFNDFSDLRIIEGSKPNENGIIKDIGDSYNFSQVINTISRSIELLEKDGKLIKKLASIKNSKGKSAIQLMRDLRQYRYNSLKKLCTKNPVVQDDEFDTISEVPLDTYTIHENENGMIIHSFIINGEKYDFFFSGIEDDFRIGDIASKRGEGKEKIYTGKKEFYEAKTGLKILEYDDPKILKMLNFILSISNRDSINSISEIYSPRADLKASITNLQLFYILTGHRKLMIGPDKDGVSSSYMTHYTEGGKLGEIRTDGGGRFQGPSHPEYFDKYAPVILG